MKVDIASKQDIKQWVKVAHVNDVPKDEGACVKYKDTQIAIFNFSSKGEWYATQNLCPHKFEMILSRGIIGDANGEPKVACPYHKKSFSLESGECLNDSSYSIETYPVKVEDEWIFIGVNED